MGTNIEKVKASYEAFNNRDLDAATSLAAEDVVWEDHGRNTTTKGRAELQASLQSWIDGFSDAKITVTEIYEAGDTVVVEFVGRGTNDGTMGPAPATGRRAELPACDVWHFGPEGKVTRGASYYDMFGLMVQLGLAEAPPS